MSQIHPEGLKWCHGCGDWVARLGEDGRCDLCEEIDARMDAHVGAAIEDYAERVINVALDYLHPADVMAVFERCLEGRVDDPQMIPLLRERFERSHRFVDERARRARERMKRGQPPKPPAGADPENPSTEQ